MTVQLSWRDEDGNRAEFSVYDQSGLVEGEPVTFGKRSEDNKRWTGKIPKTANYYIHVVAHPSARYTLKVTVR